MARSTLKASSDFVSPTFRMLNLFSESRITINDLPPTFFSCAIAESPHNFVHQRPPSIIFYILNPTASSRVPEPSSATSKRRPPRLPLSRPQDPFQAPTSSSLASLEPSQSILALIHLSSSSISTYRLASKSHTVIDSPSHRPVIHLSPGTNKLLLPNLPQKATPASSPCRQPQQCFLSVNNNSGSLISLEIIHHVLPTKPSLWVQLNIGRG